MSNIQRTMNDREEFGAKRLGILAFIIGAAFHVLGQLLAQN
jgi:hypothetical protein